MQNNPEREREEGGERGEIFIEMPWGMRRFTIGKYDADLVGWEGGGEIWARI